VLKPELELEDLNLKVLTTLNTNNKAQFGLEFTDLGLPRSQLNVSLSQFIDVEKKMSETDLSGSWKYQNDLFGLKLGGNYDIEKRQGVPDFEGQFVVQKPKNFYYSFTGKTVTEEDEKNVPITQYHGAFSLAHVTNSTEADIGLVYLKKSADKFKYSIKTNYFQKLSEQLTSGVSFTTTITEGNFKTKAVVVGEYDVDDYTTLRAKTMVNTQESKTPKMRLGFGLTQKLFAGCSVTIGADFNGQHLFNPASSSSIEPHSLGFEINLS